MIRLHLIVFGQVQGVFYRAQAKKQAGELGLVGWVRNNPDGTVELMAEGENEVLENLVEWAKSGPGHAKVEGVQEDWSKATGEFSSFEIY